MKENKVVGQTTVGAFSPFLNAGIGYVLFENHDDWLGKELNLRGQDNSLYKCQVNDLPFYDKLKKIPKGLI